MSMRPGLRRWPGAGAAVLLALILSACGSLPKTAPSDSGNAPSAGTPKTASRGKNLPALPAAGSGRGGYYQDDGPGDNPPEGLMDVPDAEPKVEPLLERANRPYNVFGTTYTPVTEEKPFRQRGIGSWYGKKFHGQKTSSGEPYDMYKMTAAHPTLPIPSYARVTNLSNGSQVIVKINDRGPFHSSRIIDLSYTAALKLGYLGKGSGLLEVERLLPDEIARIQAEKKSGKPPVAAVASSVAAPGVTVLPVAMVAQAGADAAMPAPVSPSGAAASPAPSSSPTPTATTAEGTMASRAAPVRGTPAGEGAVAASDGNDPLGLLMATSLAAERPDPARAPAGSVAPASPSSSSPAAATGGATGIYLQLGAFSQAANAHSVRSRLQEKRIAGLPPLEVVGAGALYRLFSGPFASRAEALAAAAQLQEAGVSKAVVVQR